MTASVKVPPTSTPAAASSPCRPLPVPGTAFPVPGTAVDPAGGIVAGPTIDPSGSGPPERLRSPDALAWTEPFDGPRAYPARTRDCATRRSLRDRCWCASCCLFADVVVGQPITNADPGARLHRATKPAQGNDLPAIVTAPGQATGLRRRESGRPAPGCASSPVPLPAGSTMSGRGHQLSQPAAADA